ncbi:MAG TPA: efflux RND transporter periplasmic adaptor subunit [Gemmatimonadaceae bacterium]|nr:efflux RND transporter periplasmic adaptor subunit [Gemmatimonadaceae bacterium]
MTRNRMVAILVAVLVVGGLLIVRHKRVVQMNNAPVLAAPVTAVQVVAVRRGPLESVDHILGEVYGADDAEITPQVSGQVLAVLVREGASVARGAVLARLDSRELGDAAAAGEADVEAARAASEAQGAATARDSVLFVNKAISLEQWQGSQAMRAATTGRFEVARQRLDQANARLGYAVVRAPFTGVVSARMADPGDLAVPGRPLLRMVRQSAVRVRGTVPPELMTKIHPGTPVDLSLGDEPVHATVSRIFPAMQGSHLATFEVDIAHPTPGYVAGATVGIDLHLRGGAGLLVPLDALLEGSAGTHAFVVGQTKDGAQTLRMVALTVTTRSLDQAIVEGDLREGDRVVVARPSRLMDLAAGLPVHAVDAAPGR